MTCSTDAAFRSTDGRFRLFIGADPLAHILDSCLDSHPLETGGVLIGHYGETLDTAIVTRVTGPPPDSQRRRTAFYRGTQGLQELLRALWRKNEYYLGEWHYHPGGSPEPSSTDIRRMQEIAENDDARCPEPILLVAGADCEMTLHIFPCNQETVRLTPEHDNGSSGDCK